MYDKKNNFILVLSCFVLIITFVLNYTSTFRPARRPGNNRAVTPTPIPDRGLALEAASNIGYIRSIVRDGDNYYLSFDPIVYRVGKEAQKEYQLFCLDAPDQCSSENHDLIRRNFTSKTKTFPIPANIILIIHNELTSFEAWQTVFTSQDNTPASAQYRQTPFRIEVNSQGQAVLLYEIYQP